MRIPPFGGERQVRISQSPRFASLIAHTRLTLYFLSYQTRARAAAAGELPFRQDARGENRGERGGARSAGFAKRVLRGGGVRVPDGRADHGAH